MGHFHSVKDEPHDKVMQRKHKCVLNLETAIYKHQRIDEGGLPSISLDSLKLLDTLSFNIKTVASTLHNSSRALSPLYLSRPPFPMQSQIRDQAKWITASWHPSKVKNQTVVQQMCTLQAQ